MAADEEALADVPEDEVIKDVIEYLKFFVWKNPNKKARVKTGVRCKNIIGEWHKTAGSKEELAAIVVRTLGQGWRSTLMEK
jgi:hypothetical protein